MYLKNLALKADMKEPILVEWVLDQLEDLDDDKTKAIEEQLFSDLSIQYMLDHFDSNLLTRIFQQISSQRFSNKIEMLIKRWPHWEDNLARWSAPIITQCDPSAAAKLFNSYCNKGVAQFEDFGKWMGILKSLAYLPIEEAKTISTDIIKTYQESMIDEKIKHSLSLYIVAMAWTYDHPEFDAFFQEYIVHLPAASKVQYIEGLSHLIAMFDFSPDEFSLISNILEGADVPFSETIKPFYVETIPAEVLEKAVNNLKKRSHHFMASFLDNYGHVLENKKVQTVFYHLINNTDLMNRLHRKKQRPYVYAMVFACILASLKKEKMDLSGVTVDEAVKLLSSDIENIPDLDTFISYFKNQQKEHVIRSLTHALGEAFHHFGAGHIINVMGALGYDAFLKPLTDTLSTDVRHDFVDHYAETALLNYGERAVDFFTNHFNDLNDSVKISVLGIVQKIDSPKTAEFIDKCFDSLWKLDREALLRACQTVCSEECRERLKPKINKGQTLIDQTYIILTLLNDPKATEIDDLLKQYYEQQREQTEISNAFLKGELLDTVRPYIDVELRCENCCDENIYRLNQIIINEKGQGKPYIAQELRCLHCNLISSFEFTSKGMMVLSAEIMRLLLFESEQERKTAYEQSPVKFLSAISHGKAVDIGDAINKYLLEIKKNPDETENYIGLGNIYYNTNQYKKAGDSFRKAIEKDPSYLQPYFSLAKIADGTGNPAVALNNLEQGVSHSVSPKFVKGFEGQIPDFIFEYCELHKSLVQRLKRDHPLLNPSDFKVKLTIGRNAPCPCGSGKKYKKCCLNK
jgi:tetratricopeptide (TPR) repeat protein